jgi:hypothetical protein
MLLALAQNQVQGQNPLCCRMQGVLSAEPRTKHTGEYSSALELSLEFPQILD